MSINSTSIAPKTYQINSGKGTYAGPAYQAFKAIAKTYGFYKDIRPYLPEEVIKKYRTQTIKTAKYKYSTTLAGSNFASTLSKKKSRTKSSTCQLKQEYCISWILNRSGKNR